MRVAFLCVLAGCGGSGATDSGIDSGSDADADGASIDTGTDASRRDAVGDAFDGGFDAALDAGPVCATAALPPMQLMSVGDRYNVPVFVTSAPDDPDRLYVVEVDGNIRIIDSDGSVVDEPFLTVSVGADTEGGLLGLAFHPDYATNRRFYVYLVTGEPRHDEIREYLRSEADPLRADPVEVRKIVSEPDSEGNHNGGMLEFGPDGYLYLSIGDEGGANDRHGIIGNGQDPATLFGSILRLDVDGEPPYAAPGNPFDGVTGRPEVWAYGLRNPWRFSFDPRTGNLWVADVGQNDMEEVTFLQAPIAAPANFGWRAYEGTNVFDPDLVDLVEDHAAPQITYEHDLTTGVIRDGCSVTGGYVYRGAALPDLFGWYLYGDFCTRDIGAVRMCDGEVLEHVRADDLSMGAPRVTSFGTDGHGEMYILYVSGFVRKIVPAP